MTGTRKTRAQQIQQARNQVAKERSGSKNNGVGVSFLNAKRSLASGRLKK